MGAVRAERRQGFPFPSPYGSSSPKAPRQFLLRAQRKSRSGQVAQAGQAFTSPSLLRRGPWDVPAIKGVRAAFRGQLWARKESNAVTLRWLRLCRVRHRWARACPLRCALAGLGLLPPSLPQPSRNSLPSHAITLLPSHNVKRNPSSPLCSRSTRNEVPALYKC